MTAKTATYSYNWAEGVIRQVQAKYPRATDFMFENMGITRRNLIYFCANDQKAWVCLRKTIQYLGKCAPDLVSGPVTPQIAKHSLSTFLERNRELLQSTCKAYFLYLTKIVEDWMLEEQSIKVGMGEARPNPYLPSTDEDV